MSDDLRTVSELGEEGLIRLATSHLPAPPPGELWSGDDAALVALASASVLVTTDALVEGEDFDLSYCDGFDLGWKATAVNVSDIAAMAGRPTHAVVTLGLPPSTPVALVDGIGRGLAAAVERWGVAVVGGDVSAAPVIVLGVTMLGTPAGDRAVTRSGARPGDLVCVTGCLGGSWGGLRLLQRGLGDRSPALVERHLRPVARVEEAHKLAEAGATALMDVSDGLAVDLVRLMKASGTGCVCDAGAVPVDPGLGALVEAGVARDDELLRGAILGGEDFELLATLPADAALPSGLTVIGEVTPPGRLELGDDDLEELGRQGWDHLRDR